MELKLTDGDYVQAGNRSVSRLSGTEEILARALFRLTARRGALPFLPTLGSRLYLLRREKPLARQALALQYAAEALEEETDLKVTGVALSETEGQGVLKVYLEWQGETLEAAVEI
jgi:phage gp46-like protein